MTIGSLRIAGGTCVGLIGAAFALDTAASSVQFILGYSATLAGIFALYSGIDARRAFIDSITPRRHK